MPALVAWGMKDPYIPARFGREYAAALPRAELLELPDAGHWPWLDEPRARRPPGGLPERRVIGLVRRAPAWTITAALGLIYLILAPSSPDLATASYRSYLFSKEGLTLWDNAWYGGHHLLAYSLLSPALGALVAPQLLAVLSMTLATALFAAIIEGHFPHRATRVASVWFAIGAAVSLLSCRVAFDLGLAIGLGALLSAQRRRPWLALALTVICSLASPVAGAFLALAMVAWALAGPERGWPAALALAALAPIAAARARVPRRWHPAV